MNEDEMFKTQIAGQLANAFGNKHGGYLTPDTNHQGSILTFTNPEEEIAKLELALKNMRLDDKGEAQALGEPLMNDIGISSVLGQVSAIVNRVSIVSNFEEKHIEGLMIYFSEVLIKDLMMNKTKYGIKYGYDRDKIVSQSSSIVFGAMMRALNEGERRFWKGSQQEITTRVEGLKGNNKGWGNMLKNAFK